MSRGSLEESGSSSMSMADLQIQNDLKEQIDEEDREEAQGEAGPRQRVQRRRAKEAIIREARIAAGLSKPDVEHEMALAEHVMSEEEDEDGQIVIQTEASGSKAINQARRRQRKVKRLAGKTRSKDHKDEEALFMSDDDIAEDVLDWEVSDSEIYEAISQKELITKPALLPKQISPTSVGEPPQKEPEIEVPAGKRKVTQQMIFTFAPDGRRTYLRPKSGAQKGLSLEGFVRVYVDESGVEQGAVPPDVSQIIQRMIEVGGARQESKTVTKIEELPEPALVKKTKSSKEKISYLERQRQRRAERAQAREEEMKENARIEAINVQHARDAAAPQMWTRGCFLQF